MIANNKQLAAMVGIKAGTKADLAGIEGIGEARITKYGEDILKILKAGLLSGQTGGQDVGEKETKA